MRLKKGYIAALLIINITYCLMPWIEGMAVAERGFATLGGEYLIPVMASIISLVIIQATDEWYKEKQRKQRIKYCNRELMSLCEKKWRQHAEDAAER